MSTKQDPDHKEVLAKLARALSVKAPTYSTEYVAGTKDKDPFFRCVVLALTAKVVIRGPTQDLTEQAAAHHVIQGIVENPNYRALSLAQKQWTQLSVNWFGMGTLDHVVVEQFTPQSSAADIETSLEQLMAPAIHNTQIDDGRNVLGFDTEGHDGLPCYGNFQLMQIASRDHVFLYQCGSEDTPRVIVDFLLRDDISFVGYGC